MTPRQADILRLLRLYRVGFNDFSDADWLQVVAMARVKWVFWDENNCIGLTQAGRDVIDGTWPKPSTGSGLGDEGLKVGGVSDAAE